MEHGYTILLIIAYFLYKYVQIYYRNIYLIYISAVFFVILIFNNNF